MAIIEDFADSNGVKIHYIDSNSENAGLTPLLICPGLSESVQDYFDLASSLSSRRVVVLSFRGRGRSESPKTGYSLEHHVDDIDAVVKKSGLKKFCLMGYSRGVSYAIGYGLENPSLLRGLIIEDYPAEHKKMPVGWAKEYQSFLEGTYPANKISPDAINGIEEESSQVYFWPKLSVIDCPALILRGGRPESLLTLEQANMYLTHLKNAQVEIFEDAGHDIQTNNYERFAEIIMKFLGKVDTEIN